MTHTAGTLLEGDGGCGGDSRSAAERLQGTVKAVGRQLLAVGNAVRADAGVCENLSGPGRAAVLKEGWVPPSPSSDSEIRV